MGQQAYIAKVCERLARAGVEVIQNRLDEAMNDCSRVLAKDDRNVEAYLIRSKIYY